MKNAWSECLVGTTSVATGIFLGWLALDFPVGGGRFPVFISICIILVGSWVLLTPFRNPRLYCWELEWNLPPEVRKPAMVLALSITYVFAIFWFGYYISTAIFLIAGPILAGIRNTANILIACIVSVGFIYVLFDVLLRAQLPSGLLF